MILPIKPLIEIMQRLLHTLMVHKVADIMAILVSIDVIMGSVDR